MRMRTGSFLLAPALALVLTGCARDDTARNEGAERSQQAQSTEEAGEAARTDARPAEQARNAERQPAEAAPGAGTEARESRTEARSQSRETGRREARTEATQPRASERASRTLAPYGGRSPRTDEARAERVSEIPAGAVLRVRLDRELDTEKNETGDKFTATLEEPVVVEGRVAIPKGTRFEGSITTAESSGRLSGKGVLTVKLDSFELNGKKHDITSTTATRVTDGHGKRDIGIIGGSAAAGAAIGAVTGGGKGAAIGAGAGAAAGTGVAAATGKQDVKIPAETVMVFTLQNAVELTG